MVQTACDSKVSVLYSPSFDVEKEFQISLLIDNSYGYVTSVEVHFNRRGQRPGEDCILKLNYDSQLFDGNRSTFVGKKVFNYPGYRTFIIYVKFMNGEEKVVSYDPINDCAMISDRYIGASHYFWECFGYYDRFVVPDRIRGGVLYQIFIDTHKAVNIPDEVKENIIPWDSPIRWEPVGTTIENGVEVPLYSNYTIYGSYGGNLEGIISDIPRIKSLGVTAIYLTPILDSPSTNRYDTRDYYKIDKMVGSNDDLERLVNTCHEFDIDLGLDLVFNHCSCESPLIEEHPGMFTVPPTYWWGFKTLVQFCQESEEYKKYIAEYLRFIEKRVDFIRLDVADNLLDETLKIIRANFHKYILGEVWKDAVTGEYREFLIGDELDGVMNYRFGNAIYKIVRWKDFESYNAIVNKITRLYPPKALDVSPIFCSSHDIPRKGNILTNPLMPSNGTENVWDIDKLLMWYKDGKFDTYFFRHWSSMHDLVPLELQDEAFKLEGLLLLFQYTLPGLPVIFSGDEVGVQGLRDPFNRKPFPWKELESERSQKYFNMYVRFGKFRNAHQKVLADSRNFKPHHADKHSCVYQRDKLTILANYGEKEINAQELVGTKIVFTVNCNGERDNSLFDGYVKPYEGYVVSAK